MTALPTVECKLCGNQIVWADGTLASGAPGKLPLDARAPCYVARADFGRTTARRDRDAYVLHHALCPKLRKTNPSPADDLEKARLRLEIQQLRDRVAVLTSMLPSRPA